MLTKIVVTIFVIGMFSLGLLAIIREDKKPPLEVGTHWYYTITCENGYKYKILNDRRGVIQLLGKDGKPLKCD